MANAASPVNLLQHLKPSKKGRCIAAPTLFPHHILVCSKISNLLSGKSDAGCRKML